MDEKMCKFYAAQLALGLRDLHSQHIVYRDLKPENILLDERGNLMLSDFGLACILAKEDGYKTSGQSGTRGYQAPEVLADRWYGTEVDVFSYGVVIYELLHGVKPFSESHQNALYDMSAAQSIGPSAVDGGLDQAHIYRKFADFALSSKLSREACSFISGLLAVDSSKRLGCGPRGWEEIKEHAFFNGIDWARVEALELTPPIKPNLDQANCSADADLADQLLDRKPRQIKPELQARFKGWSFRTHFGSASRDSAQDLAETDKSVAAAAAAAAASPTNKIAMTSGSAGSPALLPQQQPSSSSNDQPSADSKEVLISASSAASASEEVVIAEGQARVDRKSSFSRRQSHSVKGNDDNDHVVQVVSAA